MAKVRKFINFRLSINLMDLLLNTSSLELGTYRDIDISVIPILRALYLPFPSV